MHHRLLFSIVDSYSETILNQCLISMAHASILKYHSLNYTGQGRSLLASRSTFKLIFRILDLFIDFFKGDLALPIGFHQIAFTKF